MKRLAVVWRTKRVQLLVTLVALVGLPSAAYGSGASLSSASANAGNVFTGGVLAMSDDRDGAAVLVAERMVPGEERQGTVVIRNTGNVAGRFYLNPAAVTDSGKGLKSELILRVVEEYTEDGGQAQSVVVYEGPLDRLGQSDRGLWAPQQQRTYTFRLAFPDTGRGRENAYKKAAAGATFSWTAVSVPQ